MLNLLRRQMTVTFILTHWPRMAKIYAVSTVISLLIMFTQRWLQKCIINKEKIISPTYINWFPFSLFFGEKRI